MWIRFMYVNKWCKFFKLKYLTFVRNKIWKINIKKYIEIWNYKKSIMLA